jgi:hypothetical protein
LGRHRLRRRFFDLGGGFGPEVRPAVGETLADDALQRPRSPRRVIDAQRDAVRVPEVELSGVAVKVLLRAMLMAIIPFANASVGASA